MIKQLWNIENTNANIERAREIIEKWLIKIADFNNDLENKRLDTLKNCLDSIKQKKKDNILENVLKIPDDFKKRLLKKNKLFIIK